MIVGEIKRRLKNFDESKKHFEGLKTMTEFQGNQLEARIHAKPEHSCKLLQFNELASQRA